MLLALSLDGNSIFHPKNAKTKKSKIVFLVRWACDREAKSKMRNAHGHAEVALNNLNDFSFASYSFEEFSKRLPNVVKKSVLNKKITFLRTKFREILTLIISHASRICS